MASLERRNGTGSFRLVFQYYGRQHYLTLGHVSPATALARKAEIEYKLQKLKQGIETLPPGLLIVDYLRYDGHPPGHQVSTIGELHDQYLSFVESRMAADSLCVVRRQFAPVVRLFGGKRQLDSVRYVDLQNYVDRRAASRVRPIAPATIQKEIGLLRRAMRWARAYGKTKVECPGDRLRYAKSDEPNYCTLSEAHRRIGLGEPLRDVRRGIYLLPTDTEELLALVKERQDLPAWVYPLFVFAAHTGARRAEMLRVHPMDVRIDRTEIVLRERKRDQTKHHTYRLVPMTPLLLAALEPLLQSATGRNEPLFSMTEGPISDRQTRHFFRRAIKGSRFAILRGWHTFRHSLISGLASRGVDQRIIDDLVGHTTEEQRRRYRHLFPNVAREAINATFGDVLADPETTPVPELSTAIAATNSGCSE